MTKRKQATAIILMHCADQKGVVSAITTYLYDLQANIVDLDQHVDEAEKHFFMRVEWELDGFTQSRGEIGPNFQSSIAQRFSMQWQLQFSDEPLRMAIFVSKSSHCLYDLIQRYQSGEWNVEIPLIISNHDHLSSLAERFEVPFHHVPVTRDKKQEAESKAQELLAAAEVDLVVLARYMQILSGDFVANYPNRIINIHHSFLPAFIGARPYHQAYDRGVKVIGATSHYVTTDLDQGPIIAQDVEPISHKDSVQDLIRKGKNLEKGVLSKAVWSHLQHQILPFKNRTIVF